MPFVAVASFAQAAPIKRTSLPTLSPDGSAMLFSWQGDIWRVARTGGRAERLTVHAGNDSNPRFFPDGSRVAFSSNRFGSTDVFTMKPDGTDIRRVTFESGTELPTAVSPDGSTIYGTTTNFGRADLFRVSSGGGDVIRLTDHPFEMEYNPSISPDGKSIYYNRGSYGPASWRKPAVYGSAVGDVWVADNTVPLRNHRNLTKSDANELMPIALANGELVHQSNKSGWPNIYLGNKQLTKHSDGTVRNPQVSADGRWIAYEFNSEIWTYDLKTGANQRVEIDVPDDARLNPNAELSLSTGVSDYAVAPDGKRTVLQIRGELFLIPERGGTTRRLTKNVAWDGQPIWTDPKTILYVAAEMDGRRTFKTVDINGAGKDFLTNEKLDVTHPLLSPDGKTIAFHRGTSEICVMPVAGGEIKTVLKGNFGDALDGDAVFGWSPDNKWLVVSLPTDRGVNVVVVSVDGSKQIIVGRVPRFASRPQFLPNGRGVYFTASDSEGSQLFVVDLVPADVTFTEDDLDKIDAARPEAKKEVTVTIYEPWIERRLRRLTNAQQGVGLGLASPDSRTIWVDVDGQLSAVPVSGGAAAPVPGVTGSAAGLSVAANGQKVYFVQAGRLNGLTLGAPAAAPVNFTAQMSVNLRDEEMALFNEIGWAMDRLYYDEKLHGHNWAGIRAKFAKVVPFVFDRTDFYGLMGEMMEELNSSHLGATAPPADPPTTTPDSTGYLGIEFDPVALAARKSYIVSRVVEGAPASQPTQQLMVGDKITKVDGTALGGEITFVTLMNRTSGRKVNLTIERGGKSMEMLVRPGTTGLRNGLEYENYVAWQRSLVDKLSGGQLAYFHIDAMDATSYQRFLVEIRTLTPGKKGAIVDVRFNGGGSTAHQVLGVLIKKPWLMRTTRGEFGVRISENIFRGDSLEVPTAMMINQGSYSNAEVIAEGFRRLKMGPIIGERTPGYVIGTGGYTLWDGGFIRMPSIGAFGMAGDNLENDGRRPDFNVPFNPDAWLSGRDTQTEKAVEELLKIVNKK